jgi:sugar-specific transcriptional regulator TrmB
LGGRVVPKEARLEIAPVLKAALADVGIVAHAAEIYTFLLKKGPQRAKDITKFVGTNKALVYRSLKYLQAKGFVTSRLDFPTSFEATPLSVMLDKLAKCKKREAEVILRNKELCRDVLRDTDITETTVRDDEFSIFMNLHLGVLKSIEMARQTRSEYLIMSDQLASYSHDFVKDVVSVATNTVRNKARFRLITHVDCMNLNEAKKIVARLDMNSGYIEIRHLELSPILFPRFALSDENALILNFDSWQEHSEHIPSLDKMIWTTNITLIRLMKLLFNEEWSKSTDIRKKIAELENKPFQASENQDPIVRKAFVYSSYRCGAWNPEL